MKKRKAEIKIKKEGRREKGIRDYEVRARERQTNRTEREKQRKKLKMCRNRKLRKKSKISK